jgi:hypothetical protein
MESKPMPSEPPKDIDAIFLDGTLIDAAVRKAARLAWIAHKREGLPIPVWKDGQTVWIPPDEIEIPEDEASEGCGPAGRGQYDEGFREGSNVIILDPDVARSFKTSEAVNRALRHLLDLAKHEVPEDS